MAKLERAIIKAILQALLGNPYKLSFLGQIIAFFTLIRVPLQRFQDELFKSMRQEAWAIDEEEYRRSFNIENEKGKPDLHSLSELGYSGSVRPSPFSSDKSSL